MFRRPLAGAVRRQPALRQAGSHAIFWYARRHRPDDAVRYVFGEHPVGILQRPVSVTAYCSCTCWTPPPRLEAATAPAIEAVPYTLAGDETVLADAGSHRDEPPKEGCAEAGRLKGASGLRGAELIPPGPPAALRRGGTDHLWIGGAGRVRAAQCCRYVRSSSAPTDRRQGRRRSCRRQPPSRVHRMHQECQVTQPARADRQQRVASNNKATAMVPASTGAASAVAEPLGRLRISTQNPALIRQEQHRRVTSPTCMKQNRGKV